MGLKRLLGISATTVSREGWRVDGDRIIVDLEKNASLRDPGNALRLEGEGLDTRLLVLHGIDGDFHAYKNNCACSGWRVDPVPGEERVRCCTLASSTFDYSGKRVSGPAEKDLEALEVEQVDDVISIRLSG